MAIDFSDIQQGENMFTMKEILTIMFQGWILYEASYEQMTSSCMQPTRSAEDAMKEACGGDERMAALLVLFGVLSNDIVGIAAHYGVGLARKQPDGTLLYPDGTLDTLMKGGELVVTEVPPPPSADHYWSAGRWNLIER